MKEDHNDDRYNAVTSHVYVAYSEKVSKTSVYS